MRQYTIKETKEISKIICNKCGREIQAANGRLQVDSFDLCEKCYDEFVATFLFPIGK